MSGEWTPLGVELRRRKTARKNLRVTVTIEWRLAKQHKLSLSFSLSLWLSSNRASDSEYLGDVRWGMSCQCVGRQIDTVMRVVGRLLLEGRTNGRLQVRSIGAATSQLILIDWSAVSIIRNRLRFFLQISFRHVRLCSLGPDSAVGKPGARFSKNPRIFLSLSYKFVISFS